MLDFKMERSRFGDGIDASTNMHNPTEFRTSILRRDMDSDGSPFAVVTFTQRDDDGCHSETKTFMTIDAFRDFVESASAELADYDSHDPRRDDATDADAAADADPINPDAFADGDGLTGALSTVDPFAAIDHPGDRGR